MTDTPGLARVIGRGLRQCCPACGRGKLFRTYLKQVDTCEVCGAPLGDIRADDGPAWLTVLTLGSWTENRKLPRALCYSIDHTLDGRGKLD